MPGESKATFVEGLPSVNLVDLGWEAHARGTLLRVAILRLVTSWTLLGLHGSFGVAIGTLSFGTKVFPGSHLDALWARIVESWDVV